MIIKEKIGLTGFEPAAPTTPKWCATRLRYSPLCQEIPEHRLLFRGDNTVAIFSDVNLGRFCGFIPPGFSYFFDTITMVSDHAVMHSLDRKECIEPQMHLWERLTEGGNAIVAMFVKVCHNEEIGVGGFGPPTTWSRTRCATRLRYTT